MNLKTRLAALLAALFALLVVLPSSAAQAGTSPGNVQVEVQAHLSDSNMLVSFEDSGDGSISQHLVCEGCVHGEGSGSYVFSEPINAWVNPGWCMGFRTRFWDRNTNVYTYSAYNYYTGGANGLSVFIGRLYLQSHITARAQIHLYDC